MKKILVLLLSLFLLAGCGASDGYAHVSNEKDPVFTSGNETFTKGDLFYAIRSYDYTSILMNDLVYTIMEKDGVDMTDYASSAESTMEMYRSIYGMENFDSYGGDDAFKQALIVDLYIQDRTKEIVEESLDTYLEEDKPIRAKVVSFANKEDADAVYQEVLDGATLEMSSLAHGYTSQVTASIYVDSDQTLPLPVKEYINSGDATGLSPVIISMTTTTDADGNSIDTPRYYLIDILSRDIADFHDEYVTLKSSVIEINEVLKRILEGHEIHFYDQEALDAMKKAYEGVFD